MIYLLLSIVALIAGPFLFSLADRRSAAREGLEGFILVTIAGIVFLHIAPEAWRAAGFASVVTGLLGLLFPSLLESIFRRALARAHLVVLALAAAGIFIHAVLDGIALLPLVTETSSAGRELAIGVIVHRLPVGMAIWWVVRPQFGTPLALAIFGLVIVTTILGYWIGEDSLASSTPVLALFQAFVAGSLIHVALVGASHEHDDGEAHGGSHDHDHGGDRLAASAGDRFRSTAYRAGLLIGLVTVFLLPHISA